MLPGFRGWLVGERFGLVLVTLRPVASVGAGNTCRGLFLLLVLCECPGDHCVGFRGLDPFLDQLPDQARLVISFGKKLIQFRVLVAVDL